MSYCQGCIDSAINTEQLDQIIADLRKSLALVTFQRDDAAQLCDVMMAERDSLRTQLQQTQAALDDKTIRFKISEAKLQQVEEALADLHAKGMCDACGGNGTPVSGRPCICGGSGFVGDGFTNLRRDHIEQRERLQQTQDVARELLAALKDAAQLLSAAPMSFPYNDRSHEVRKVAYPAIQRAQALLGSEGKAESA